MIRGARLAFRFLSGRPMDGVRRTDATFWRPATRSLDPSGHMMRWERMRGAARAAWRIGGAYVIVLLLLTTPLALAGIAGVRLPWWARASTILGGHLLLAALLAAGWLLNWLRREFGYRLPYFTRGEGVWSLRWLVVEGARSWRKEKVLPIARSASVILGCSIPERSAARSVHVPENYRDGGSVEILLPHSFTGADEGVKRRLLASVGSKLGVRGMVGQWQTEGSAPRVLISAPPVPPSLVVWSDVARYYEDTEEFVPFLGVAAGGEALHARMTDDSPHFALSAGSGAGKSELIKGLAMQALHWGWGLIVLDWKAVSHEWAKGLPGVKYLTDITAIHDMCVRLGEEVDIRKDAYTSDLSLPGRARVLVVCEEWNITAALLADYWMNLRATAEQEERATMPLRSPALRGLMVANFAGRQLGVYLFMVAQRFSARVTNGNADLRESFQVRFLARYSDNTRKMLCPDIKPFPKKPDQLGQWVAVIGSDAVIYQVPLITDSEARAFAQGGTPNPLSPLSSSYDPSSKQLPDVDIELEDQLLCEATEATPAIEAHPVSPMKLIDLWEGLAHLGITHRVLRNASHGDDSFPKPVAGDQFSGYRYDPVAMTEWARRRHAERVAKRR